MAKEKGLIYGIARNDADYDVEVRNGKIKVVCPFFRKWFAMLSRCYNEINIKRNPSYYGCYVCDDWLAFSNFKSWMEKQDWQGKELDKDLLVTGNKIYSPETCCFIPHEINVFMVEGSSRRGTCLLGVTYVKKKKLYRPRCNNPFTKTTEELGQGKSEFEAHIKWKRRKHELACIYADMQKDERIANALRLRYAS